MSGAFYDEVLVKVQVHSDDDPIHQCEEGIDLSRLVHDSDKLFQFANDKLHVFPFKSVRACWFRLYTDTSIVRAIFLAQHRREDESLQQTDSWIDGVVSILDMALIMAGGLGRVDLIHDLILNLQQERAHQRQYRHESLRLLPQDEISVPRVRFEIKKIECPSMLSFQQNILQEKAPIVLEKILDDWPALQRWQNIDYLLDVTFQGRRLVPIEVGRSYVDDDWGQKIVPFRIFLDNHILNSPAATGYLAQHDLLGQIRAMRADIMIPDYCYLDTPQTGPEGSDVYVEVKSAAGQDKKTSHPTNLPFMNDDSSIHTNIWFGPAWTISPLHYDPYHNILCQVVGKKYIRLYTPEHSANLYPRSKQEPAPHASGSNSPTIDMSNTSEIDFAAIELSPDEDWDELYPGISKIPYKEVILEAGQALYIPVGWWHYVRSISVGISVSFWWS